MKWQNLSKWLSAQGKWKRYASVIADICALYKSSFLLIFRGLLSCQILTCVKKERYQIQECFKKFRATINLLRVLFLNELSEAMFWITVQKLHLAFGA